MSKSYDEFIKQYRIDHKACPVCNGTSMNTTLCGYIFNSNDPDSYKDRNAATCMTCGWKGIRHDLIRLSEPLSDREKILFEAFIHIQEAVVIYNDLLGGAQFDESIKEDVEEEYEKASLYVNKSVELMKQYETLAK